MSETTTKADNSSTPLKGSGFLALPVTSINFL